MRTLSTRTRRVDLIIAGAALASLAAGRAGRPAETDPFWQIRAGLEQLAGTPTARPDTWSWAPVDGLFYPTSPGWNSALGVAWESGGFWGFFLLSWAAIVTYLALTFVIAAKLGAQPLPALAGVAVASLLASPMLSARATIIVQSMLLVSLVWPLWWARQGLRHGAAAGALTSLAVGLLVSGVGNWIHLSWLAWAPAVAVAWGAFWLVTNLDEGARPSLARLPTEPKRLAPALGGLVGLLSGCLIAPYGIAGGLDRVRATREAAEGLLIEWLSPFTPGLSLQWPIAALVSAAFAVGLTSWWVILARQADWDAVARITPFAVLVVPSAVAGLLSIRFLGVALLTGAPVLALAFTALAGRVRVWASLRPAGALGREQALRWSSGRSWRVVLAVVLVLLLPGTLSFAANRGQPAAAAAVATLPASCNLFGPASVADVSLLLRPDVRVWFDGRADYYGRARIIETRDYLRGTGSTAVPTGTTCVLLPTPGAFGGTLAARLDSDPRWRGVRSAPGYTLWATTALED